MVVVAAQRSARHSLIIYGSPRIATLGRHRWLTARALHVLQALHLCPGHVDSQLALARVWLEAGQPARAEPLLSAALATRPDDPCAHKDLADALWWVAPACPCPGPGL